MTIFARNNRASTLPNGTPAIATQEETASESFYMHVLQVGYGESPTPFPTSFYTAELDDADTDEDDLTEDVDLDDEDMDDEADIDDDDDFADEDFADEDDVEGDEEESTEDGL